MTREQKMILGYVVGGSLVFVLVPCMIFILTQFADQVYRIEMISNTTVRWSMIAVLFAAGCSYGISSVVIQNTVGQGGPLEIGNLEISPKTKKLVVSGPYTHTRNPMLFGTFLLYLAFALLLNSLTAVVLVGAILVFMLTVVVKMEEQRLLQDFGDEYTAYQHRVSRFIPWFPKKSQDSKRRL